MARYVKGAMPIVHVTWHDSIGSSGWHRQAEYSEFVSNPQRICYTAGFLAKRDGSGVYIAQSQQENGNLGALLYIPRSAIQKVSIIARLEKVGG